MTANADIDYLRQWVGRSEITQADVTAQQFHAFNATIGGDLSLPQAGEPAPLAFHWCLAPRISSMVETDRDGHPKKGGFLPPIPLPRRMWAGGELEFLAPLRVGDSVKRQSRIDSVDLKNGRSGPLCFVTLTHEIAANGVACIRERQDIVYRDNARVEPTEPSTLETISEPFEAERVIDPSPVLLFRYSALTFNSHRIHYDADYAIREEGYPGLVVHGPLQATLLLHHAAAIARCAPRRFSYRSVAALTNGSRFWIRSAAPKEGSVDCWSGSEAVPVAMKAQASW